MAEIYNLDSEGNGNRGLGDAATLLAASALANNGGGNVWGGNFNPLTMAFTLPFVMPFMMPFMSMMYNGMGGIGGFGGWGGNGGAGFISNQLNNDAGRQLIMQAVQNNGTAIDRLATLLNTTHDQIQEGISGLKSDVLGLGNNINMTGLQIINAMQSGNAGLQSSIAQGLAGILAQMNANSKDEAMAHCQQTYNLTDTINRGFLSLDNKIDAMESSRKDRELAQKDAIISELKSQNFISGALGQNLAPIIGALNSLRSEVDAVKCKLPETMTLPNTQYAIVPNWAANIGSDFVASYWANRLSAATGGTTTTTPATGA